MIAHRAVSQESNADSFSDLPLLILMADTNGIERVRAACRELRRPLITLRPEIGNELSKESPYVFALITQSISGIIPDESKIAIAKHIPVIALAYNAQDHHIRKLKSCGVFSICTDDEQLPSTIRLLQHAHPFIRDEGKADQFKNSIANYRIIEDLKNLSSNPYFFQNLIQVYLYDVRIILEEIGRALQNGDYAAWKESVHAMLGDSLSFKLSRLIDALHVAQVTPPQMLKAHGEKFLAKIIEEFRLAEMLLLDAAQSTNQY